MKLYQKYTVLTLLTLLVLPQVSSAKMNGLGLNLGLGAEAKVEKVEKPEREEKDNRKEEREERKESRENRSTHRAATCWRAFGHLIAPGFIKIRGEANLDLWRDCVLPFGITKKLNRASSPATTTVDVTAPVIRNTSVVTGTTTAKVTWNTNEPATFKLWYGTSSPVGVSGTSTALVSGSLFQKFHTALLSNLTASTTYYFVIEAKDKSGNATTSLEASLLTK